MRRPNRSWTRWLPALMLAVLACPLVAAPTGSRGSPPLADYFRETWRSADGLPHNLVNNIAQTPEGYLWFATWEGLARFNGREFTVFDRQTLPQLGDAGVRTLHVDREGTLWIGGSRGTLARLRDATWTFLPPAGSLINALLDDSAGRIWIATENNGLERVDPDGSRQRFGIAEGLPSDGIYSLLEDGPDRLLVGTARGLGLVEAGRVVALAGADGLPAARVFALFRRSDGAVLVGTEQGLFALQEGRVEPVLPALIGSESVTRLAADSDGNLWLGTVNLGVLRISPEGVDRLDAAGGLPNNRVQSLFPDRDGHMWAGTNGGLMRFRTAPFSSYTRAHGLGDDYVRALLERADGSLWVGTSTGLVRQTGPARFVPVAGTEGQAGLSVLSLAEHGDGSIWIGTYARGLLQWRDGRIVRTLSRQHGIGGNEVRALLPEADGGLWIGTSNGLSHRARDGTLRTLGVEDGLPGAFIVALHRAVDGRLWIGTGTGVAWLDADGIHRLPLDPVTDAEFVFGFHEAGDALWMATDRGLLRLRDGGLSHVGRAQGMPFDKVFNLVDDGRGNFWIGSNRGVLRLAAAEAQAAADGERGQVAVEWFAEADGLASAQCNGGSGPSALRRRDGSVWFATALGVAAVQPARLDRFRTADPPAIIEQVRADGVTLDVGRPLQLAAGTSRLELAFAGLGYVMPQRIRYQQWLEGFDSGWVDRGHQAIAEFTNLEPGDYRFRVRAAYPGGDWTGREAHVDFSIPPLPWQRPLFWWAMAALVVIALFTGVRLRVRRLEQAQLHLREQVDQRTADLRRQTERLQAADHEKTELLERLRRQSDQFERQAREDALTGLANRRAFDEALAAEVARAERSGRPLCLALADVDHFKRINDGWSHAVGDDALRRIADVIRSQYRAIDAVARWGGEEFAILLPYTALSDALAACERLRAAIERIEMPSAPGLHLSISIGVATHVHGQHYEKLVSQADAALYRAKQGGRNRVCS